MWTDKKLEDLRVSPEFASRIPPLSDREFRQLEENILSEGCAWSPIVSWNDVIVDGHNRYRILLKHPEIHYFIYEKSFPDMESALAWICKNQLGRRNLTPNQRKYLIGKQYSSEKQSYGGARNIKREPDEDSERQEKSGAQCVPLKPEEKTYDRIARENRVSHMYVKRAEKYADGLDEAEEIFPGIRQKILKGDLKVTAKEMKEVAADPDPETKKERVEIILGKRPGKESGELRRIREISEKMASAPNARGRAEDGYCSNDDTAVAELTDAWRSFHNRWELCFEEFVDDCPGEAVRKTVRKITGAAVKYLKKKEEEVNEIN